MFEYTLIFLRHCNSLSTTNTTHQKDQKRPQKTKKMKKENLKFFRTLQIPQFQSSFLPTICPNSISLLSLSSPGSPTHLRTITTMIEPTRKKRQMLVCTLCRERKVRCDRMLPCLSCVRHKTESSCTYGRSSEEMAISGTGTVAPESGIGGGTNKIDGNMEIMGKKPASNPSLAVVIGAVKQRPGKMGHSGNSSNSGNSKNPGNSGYIGSIGSARSGSNGSIDPGPIGSSGYGSDYGRDNEDNQRHQDTVYLAPTTTADLLAQFKSMKSVIGVNPVSHGKDHINFYQNYSSVSFNPNTLEEINHGPFLWHSVVRVDPGLLQVWSFIMNVKPTTTGTNGITGFQSLAQGNESAQLQVIEKIKQHLLVKFGAANSALCSQDVPLGLTFNDPNSHLHDMELVDRLRGILPCRHIIWSHIDRFFLKIYPFYPYLDEQLFRGSLTRIIGACVYDNSRVENLAAKGATDYALIGILCIVLRLSYLSLISNDRELNIRMKSAHSTVSESLLATPLGLEFVDLARQCLHHYQVLNRSNLTILQLLVYTRIYMELSPEDLEGPARDVYQLNNGVLLQMAYVIGLNREPDLMTDTLNNKRLNHVRRKLWIFIQFKGILNSLKFGSPFIASTMCTDTRFPFFNESNSNCSHPELDRYVELSFSPLEELITLMSNVSGIILQVKEGTSMVELVQHVNRLECFVFQKLGTLRNCLESFFEEGEKSVVPILLAQYHLPIHVFLISLHFRLFAYYESGRNNLLAFFYCKKILLLIAEEMLPFASVILEKEHPYFGYAAQLVINPQIEYFMHRSVGFLGAWTARVGNQIMFTPGNVPCKEPFSKERFLLKAFGRLYKLCLLSILKINHRYCYAWRIGCTFSYILKCVVTEGFYLRLNEAGIQPLKTIIYSDDQMKDLTALMNHSLKDCKAKRDAQYFDVVKEVIKFGNSETSKLYDPSQSKSLFNEIMRMELGEIQGVKEPLLAEELLADPSWFPSLDGLDMTSIMGSFFEGPEAYFDSFRDITTGPVFQNYGF